MESIATAYLRLISNYRFQTANYVMYIYDHLMTFSDEVDKIWSQKLTFATLLFYINRYITHCQFIILQVEFQETTWTDSMCDRYVRFAGAATLSLVAVAELTMIFRIYALYLGNKFILLFLLLVLSGQICFMAWAVHFGERVPLPPGFPGIGIARTFLSYLIRVITCIHRLCVDRKFFVVCCPLGCSSGNGLVYIHPHVVEDLKAHKIPWKNLKYNADHSPRRHHLLFCHLQREFDEYFNLFFGHGRSESCRGKLFPDSDINYDLAPAAQS